jgi:hypothetical protein
MILPLLYIVVFSILLKTMYQLRFSKWLLKKLELSGMMPIIGLASQG